MTTSFHLLFLSSADNTNLLVNPTRDLPAQNALQLKRSFAEKGLPISFLTADGNTQLDCPALHDLHERNQTLVVCGAAPIETFAELLKQLSTHCESKHKTIIVSDAIQVQDGDLEHTLEQFDASFVQLCKKDTVIGLLDLGGRFIYPYAKVDVSASVVVFFENGKRVLLVKRKFDPHKGSFSFPSGFLRPLLEDLPGCACRELFEETGLKLDPDQLQLVNVRSNPGRDPRGHVIDHGYWKLLSTEEEKQAISAIRAGDDAEEITLMDLSKAVCLPLAADHGSLLIDACMALSRHSTQTRVRLPVNFPLLPSLVTNIRRKLAT